MTNSMELNKTYTTYSWYQQYHGNIQNTKILSSFRVLLLSTSDLCPHFMTSGKRKCHSLCESTACKINAMLHISTA